MLEKGPHEWTKCAERILGRNGKQCRERWVNILDPQVRIGGWDDSEQERIFLLIREHMTSWSSISKNLVGRTENAIKNYFYSTIRRIHTCPVMHYIMDKKNNLKVNDLESEAKFEEHYKLDKLNRLGVIMCLFIRKGSAEMGEEQPMYDYLIRMIADEKKVIKVPKLPDENESEDREARVSNLGLKDNGLVAKDHFSKSLSLKSKQLVGVHPCLPLALYGKITNMNPKDIFGNLKQMPNLQKRAPMAPFGSFRESGEEHDSKIRLPDELFSESEEQPRDRKSVV